MSGIELCDSPSQGCNNTGCMTTSGNSTLTIASSGFASGSNYNTTPTPLINERMVIKLEILMFNNLTMDTWLILDVIYLLSKHQKD